MTRPILGGRSANQAFREAVTELAAALVTVDRTVADLYDIREVYAYAALNLTERTRDSVRDRQVRNVWNHDPKDLDERLDPVRSWLADAKMLLMDLPGSDFSPADSDAGSND